MSGNRRIDSRMGSEIIRKLFQTAKVATGTGWTVNAAANTFMSTVDASRTACKAVMPLNGLNEGDIITGFHLLGALVSAGNTVTLDCALYEFVPAAAASAAAALASAAMTQISITANVVLGESNSKLTLPDHKLITVRADRSYFALLTATTGASCNIELLGLVLALRPNR